MIYQGKVESFFGEYLSLFSFLGGLRRVEPDHIRPEEAGHIFHNLFWDVILEIHAGHPNNGIPQGIIIGLVKLPD